MKNQKISFVVALCLAAFVLPCSANTLYWFGPDTIEGGNGQWNTTATHWSTTSPSKTNSTAIPTLSETVVFAGDELSSIVSIMTGNVAFANEIQVNSSGYVFEWVAGTNMTVNSFSGSQLSSATIRASGNFIAQITVGSNAAADFTGTVENGSGTLSIRKSGTGTLALSGASVNYSGTTLVDGGSLVLNSPTALGAGVLTLASTTANQGVMGTTGTFTRSLGTTAGTIRLGTNNTDSGGFSAVGGNLTVNLGGAAAQVGWGTAGDFRVANFILNTDQGTHTTTFVNDIDLTASRTVYVGNGAANIDAEITGNFASASSNVLTKTGGGTVRLSGTYQAGNMVINAGTLLMDGTMSALNNTRTVTVAAGAVLGGDGIVGISTLERTLNISGALMGGRGEGNQALNIRGTVNMLSDSYLVFGLSGVGSDQIVRDGNFGTWSFQSDQRVQLFNNGASEGVFTLMSGLASDPGVTNWQLYNSGDIEGTFSYSSGNVFFNATAIPEPSTALLALLGLSLMAWRRRR
jgi:autotransporter-associated beta strand protein